MNPEPNMAQPDFNAETPPSNPITHTPAVAVGYFNDGLGSIWAGFAFNLSGLFPLIVFFESLEEPNYVSVTLSWGFVSLLLLIGVICGTFGIKENNYQKKSLRIFGIASLCFGLICFLIPAFSSILYLTGTGN